MHVLSMVKQIAGKNLSFNNVLDLNSGRLLVEEFEVPACAIIKHNNPCGAAIGSSAREAYERAFACDPQSAFGGVVCLNRAVDRELAELLLAAVLRGPLRARASPTRRSSCSSPSRTCASSRTTSAAASTSPSATSSA